MGDMAGPAFGSSVSRLVRSTCKEKSEFWDIQQTLAPLYVCFCARRAVKLCQSLQTERIWGLAKALRFARPSIGFTRAVRGGLRFVREIFQSRAEDPYIEEVELEVTCLLQHAL